MKQYSEQLRRIIKEGTWVYNQRTGKNCKVLINVDMEYDSFPIVTTRKSYWKQAVAEMLGYLRGYTSAADFRKIGCNTWDANANENFDWLNNIHREGEDDMGRVYGAQGRGWRTPEGRSIDQIYSVYKDLLAGTDNRGEIISFYNPGEFHLGCLRPCMHTHQFSLVNDTLYLHSYQRSCDFPLGMNFNMVQCWFLLSLFAQITGHKVGKVFHKIVNAHIYEDQYELAIEEASRDPIECEPKFFISEEIKTLEDVETIFDVSKHCRVEGYVSHPPIAYPFSV